MSFFVWIEEVNSLMREFKCLSIIVLVMIILTHNDIGLAVLRFQGNLESHCSIAITFFHI